MNALDTADLRALADAELRRQERESALFLETKLRRSALAKARRIVRLPIEVFEDAEELLVG